LPARLELVLLRNCQTAVVLLVFLAPTIALCQTTPNEPVPQESERAETETQTQTQTQIQPLPVPPRPTPTLAVTQKSAPEAPSSAIIDPNQETLHQTPRIMGLLPNFTAVDSNTYLPRLFIGEKFIIAAHDSVDYSSFLLVAVLAGKGLYSNTIPALGTGAAGFRRYYWREFTDQVSGTFFTEAILPTLTHEDPRYYTLGKNGFFKRASYAFSRSFITRNDRGTDEFNVSEIGGNASEAALSNLYYPASERGFGKTAKNFATQMIITATANVLKEFWPDIRKNLFRIKGDEFSPRHEAGMAPSMGAPSPLSAFSR
jgi:hypothetical protein